MSYSYRPRPRLSLFAVLCSALALLPFAGIADAQTSATDRAQAAQDQTNIAGGTGDAGFTSSGHAIATPNDSDLGEQEIIGQADTYQPFTISAVASGFYTSNAALARDRNEGDFFAAPAVTFAYQPRLTPTLYADIAAQQQFFYYNRFGELDFGSFDARAGLIYIVPQLHNLSVRGGYDYNRLTVDDSLNDELFADQSLYLNGDLPFRFPDNQQLSIGGGARISVFGDPDLPRRDDFDLYLAYTIQATRSLTFSAVGRVVVRDYVLGDRVDVSESFSAALTYRFNNWATASLSSTVAGNESNHKEFDYSVANLGGALGFTVRF